MFGFKNGKVTLNTGESLSTNSAGQIIINPGTPAGPATIPHYASAPAAKAGVTQPWILDDGQGNVDYTTIQLVYPDGSNHNKQIVLNDIIFTP